MERADKLKAGKFDVDVPLVERLIAAQFPQWAGLLVRPVADDGWDNWTFRLGERLKVRLPSDTGYAEQAEKEANWLPRLAPLLPVAVPVPVGLGQPGEGYPWRWSVYDWIEGEPASPARVADRVRLATDVAGFIRALWRVDPAGGPPPGPHNFGRGGDVMAIYGAEARRSVERIAGTIDADGAMAVLDAAEAPAFTAPPVWVHGDVAVGNLLVADGRLSAVIDFGCMAVGDPACDLVLAWLFLEGESRAAFRAAIGGDAGLWARGRAWALWKAALVVANGAPINPAERSPRQVIADIVAEQRAL